MDVECLLRQLEQVFPHHPQSVLRNCINERLLLFAEDAEVGAVMDSCINWLLDQANDVLVHGVINVDEQADWLREGDINEVTVVRETEPRQESPVLTTEEILEDILSLFSDAKPDFVRQLLEKWKGKGDQANRVCNYLLENKDYPRVERVATRTKQPAIQEKKPNFFKEFSSPVCYTVRDQALALLYNEFREIAKHDILQVAAFHKFHYAATRKYLSDVLSAGGTVGYTADSVLSSPPVRGVILIFLSVCLSAYLCLSACLLVIDFSAYLLRDFVISSSIGSQ
jgi:hypothetical protein